jgi:hypothetical protein
MTFFHERHYVRYFVVQLGEKEDEDEQQQQEQEQGEQQQESERQGDYKQRLALLSSSPEALKRKDSKEINCMAEEVSAKDRTGTVVNNQFVPIRSLWLGLAWSTQGFGLIGLLEGRI